MVSHADVVVVGGGASGMMAALTAAERGRSVLLLERMDQPGRKLRITGKGRCNLTNTAPLRDFLMHVGSDSRFLRNAFGRFFNEELMQFFEQRGVPLTVERGLRVFPSSGKAQDIFMALILDLEAHSNVTIRKGCRVKRILTAESGACGVELENGEQIAAHSVVMATGGRSYPLTGSTGDGYAMLREVGHTIVPTVPSLVPLIIDENLPSETVGFTLKNATLRLCDASGHKLYEGFGELSFEEDALCGPLVLSASRVVSRLLHTGQTLTAHIDMKPAIEDKTLDKRLINDLNANGNRLLGDALRLWMPAEMVPLFKQQLKLDYTKKLHQVSGVERRRLLQTLKDSTFTVTATRGYEEAIVTQGGVALSEVEPKSMRSRKLSSLYIIGELLDLDADPGGYNLQIAFSTGFVAGQNC